MKTHLRNTAMKAEDYPNSPHIFKALSEGTMAACRAGIVGHDNLSDQPTCKACQHINQPIHMKIKPDKVDAYHTRKATNNDAYGTAIFGFAEAWADLMERAMEKNGETVAECADRCSSTADTEGITGFMYGCAVGFLSEVWEHGEALRIWHNRKYDPKSPDDGGVINPAIITIG